MEAETKVTMTDYLLCVPAFVIGAVAGYSYRKKVEPKRKENPVNSVSILSKWLCGVCKHGSICEKCDKCLECLEWSQMYRRRYFL